MIIRRKIVIAAALTAVVVLAALALRPSPAGAAYKAARLKFTNCYLLPVDDGYLLVDTGYDYEWGEFVDDLKEVGVEPSRIRYLLITHAHDDHVGLVTKLLEATDGRVRIVCSELTRRYLLTGKHNNVEGAGYINKRVGLVMRIKGKLNKGWDHTFPPVAVREDDIVISGDTALRELGIGLDGRILLTPGHTLDSVSLLLDNGDCFCGDASANFLRFLGTKYCVVSVNDLDEYYRSWDKLLSAGAAVIYPAHGKPFSARRLERNIRKHTREGMDVW